MGATPLYQTCENGHAHVVKFLIDNKANVDLKLNVSACININDLISCKIFFRQVQQLFILLHIMDTATL